jgi:hypothetical protein
MNTLDELEKLLDGSLKGPWQVVMTRDEYGVSGYRILTHSHPSIAVEPAGYWEPEYEPEADDDGYYQPDIQMDCAQWRISSARLIAFGIAALPELIARVRKLETGLAFYAEQLGYAGYRDPYASIYIETSALDTDGGKRARAALNQEPPSPGAITGIRMAETPCSDCIDGWCQLNCGPRIG